jgi:hypothetical protein
MSQQEIEEIENEVVEDMHFHYPPHSNVLRCPNPEMIIDTDFDDIYFYLLPNTTIDYKSLIGKCYIFHLELNSDKLDENQNPIKNFEYVK